MSAVLELAWRDEAVCAHDKTLTWKDFYPDEFYPAQSAEYRQAVKRAKAVCAGCPVQRDCLDYANHCEIDEDTSVTGGGGIFGGQTWHNRRDARYPRITLNGKQVYLSQVKLAVEAHHFGCPSDATHGELVARIADKAVTVDCGTCGYSLTMTTQVMAAIIADPVKSSD